VLEQYRNRIPQIMGVLHYLDLNRSNFQGRSDIQVRREAPKWELNNSQPYKAG
jgi:hypothetical protein